MDAADVASGFVSGWATVAVCHPLDTLKVLTQTQSNGVVRPGGSTGGSAISNNIHRLYRGIAPPMVASGFLSAATFASYELARNHLTGSPESPLTLAQSFAAGSFSGLVVAHLNTPINLLKVQMQVRVAAAGGGIEMATAGGRVSGIREMLAFSQTIVQNNGLRGLFRGYTLGLPSEILGRGCYFAAYTMTGKVLRSESEPPGTILPLYKRIIAGASAGIIGWLPIYPLDVLRTRVCAAEFNSAGSGGRTAEGDRVIRDVFRWISTSIQREGLGVLYRGFGLTLVRAVPVAMVSLPVYDEVRHFLHNHRSKFSSLSLPRSHVLPSSSSSGVDAPSSSPASSSNHTSSNSSRVSPSSPTSSFFKVINPAA